MEKETEVESFDGAKEVLEIVGCEISLEMIMFSMIMRLKRPTEDLIDGDVPSSDVIVLRQAAIVQAPVESSGISNAVVDLRNSSCFSIYDNIPECPTYLPKLGAGVGLCGVGTHEDPLHRFQSYTAARIESGEEFNGVRHHLK